MERERRERMERGRGRGDERGREREEMSSLKSARERGEKQSRRVFSDIAIEILLGRE